MEVEQITMLIAISCLEVDTLIKDNHVARKIY